MDFFQKLRNKSLEARGMHEIKINPSIVANFFLKKGFEEDIPIYPIKLFSLVFIAHGWSMAICEECLLDGEAARIASFGVVIPSLYHEFKKFEENAIDCFSNTTIAQYNYQFLVKPMFVDKIFFLDNPLKRKISEILESVWNAYSEYCTGELINCVKDVVKTAVINDRNEIPNGHIEAYYQEFFKRFKDG